MNTESGVAGVVLAAGRSTRMRGTNKLLASVEGVPAIVRVCSAAIRSKLHPVIVVLGHEAEVVRVALGGDRAAISEDIAFVVNPRHRDGRLSSVAAAIEALPEDCDAAMFLRGDQPWITEALIDQLVHSYRTSDATVAFPVYRGRKGSPTLFERRHFPRLLALRGDHGTLDLAEELWDVAAKVEVDDPRCLAGIDTPDDLRRLLGGGESSGGEGESRQ